VSTATNATEVAILRATGRLLQEHSLDDLSVARILAEAEVSRATFYFYFSSKDDAFVALLSGVAEDIVLLFEELLAGMDLSADRAGAAGTIASWLRLEPAARSVIQNAIHEWPRRPEIRRLYLDGVGRLATALAAKIDADRASGAAPAGVDSAELAATLLWTIERTLAGSLAQEAHLEDTAGVTDLLGNLFVATIYGR
jgi:AcrR family transcriptional regulator